MSKKFYLVTGGTGFIGSALVRLLIELGHKVRVLDNQSRGASRRLAGLEDDFELVEEDIRNFYAVEQAIKGVDCVCHLAFINGTRAFYTQPDVVLSVAVKGMINIIDSCIKNNVGELILASSSEVYQQASNVPTDETAALSIPDVHNPRYSYAAGKIISESMAINYGRKFFERILIFRPHNVYGPDMGQDHVIPQFLIRMKELVEQSNDLLPLNFPIQGTGQESRSFVYIDDFIKGLECLLEYGKHLEIYHIGTTEEVAISHLANLVSEYFRRQIVIIPGELACGSVSRRCPDISQMRRLGYQPQVRLADGLRLTADWYKENAHLYSTMKQTKTCK